MHKLQSQSQRLLLRSTWRTPRWSTRVTPKYTSASESKSESITTKSSVDKAATRHRDSQGLLKSGQWAGYSELLLVSLLWGSYSPALKMIYAEDNPLDPATLTAVRTVLSAIALAVAVMVQGQSGMDDHRTDEDNRRVKQVARSRSFNALTWTSDNVIVAGIELGLYNFAGTSLQAVGLQMTSATRAGLLIQMVAILVPVLSYLAGEDIPFQVWIAVVVGLLGSSLIAFESLGDGMGGLNMDFSTSSSSEFQGILTIMAACFFYGVAVVRLGIYAPRFVPIKLAAIKKYTLAAASLIWFWSFQQEGSSDGGILAGLSIGDQLSALGLMDRSFLSWLLIVYSALGPGALAVYLQTVGQSQVPASQAQVIFSLVPLWSTILAQLTLTGEVMGPLSWSGGAAILLANILASQTKINGGDK